MKNIRLLGLGVATVAALTFGLSGCSSSDSAAGTTGTDGTTITTAEIGTFVDAPVGGLTYKTATKSGTTNAKGEFEYKAGEKVEFKLGNLSFGEVQAGGLMTPYTMAGVANGGTSDFATNIALLLQNFDLDRANTGSLDLSKLSSFNFSDINLSATPADMESKITSKLTTLKSSGLIDSSATLITTAAVKSTMDTFINQEIATRNDITKALGTEYTILLCSPLIGCIEDDLKATFLADGIITIKTTAQTFSGIYTKESAGIVKVSFDNGNEIDYLKIVDISSTGIVSLCGEDTLAGAQACTANEAWVPTAAAASYMATNTGTLTPVAVNSFSEISGKELFQLGYSTSSSSFYYNGFKINTNGDLSAPSDGGAGFNTSTDNYNVSVSNGSLHLTGYNANQSEDRDDTYAFNKYDLTGHTIKLNEFSKSNIFHENTLSTLTKEINFTGGTMYCTILWEECWVDKTAINEMMK